jgi:PhnB protein
MADSFQLFISFNGECREAVEFYSKVFKSDVLNLMTYSQMPLCPNYTVPDSDKDKIMYCSIQIFGCTIMFCDAPTGIPFIKGNNFNPTIVTEDMNEICRLFNELKEGGKIDMELQKTFWSDLYGMVTDKYGVIWGFSHDSGKGF